jgi:hypothetical protein
MGLIGDVRRMHRSYPSSWLTAWSRVMTVRSVRVQRYLNASLEQRKAEYPWLYERRGRKRANAETEQ